jgi:hypothetical protein
MGKGVITVIFIHSFTVVKRGGKCCCVLDQGSTREDAVWALQFAGNISFREGHTKIPGCFGM